jgi:hypothetical protein
MGDMSDVPPERRATHCALKLPGSVFFRGIDLCYGCYDWLTGRDQSEPPNLRPVVLETFPLTSAVTPPKIT